MEIIHPSDITIVPSVADIFLTLTKTSMIAPSGFVFIRDKIFDANFLEVVIVPQTEQEGTTILTIRFKEVI
jgi:hypothetical protein